MTINTREELVLHQQQMMKSFRKEFLTKIPLYKGIAYAPLSRFPISNKEFVQHNFKELNSLNISFDQARDLTLKSDFPEYEGVTIGMSSGTSGKRGLFLVTKEERLKWLGIMLAKALGHKIWKKQRIALFLSANSKLYETVTHSNHMKFKFFDLKEGLDSYFDELQQYQPTILIAPSQVLNLLSHYQEDKEFKIYPDKIFSAGEVLEDDHKKNIHRAFKVKPDQIYQCTEGFLGITCEYGTIHLNEEYVHFEKKWIDKKRRAFNPVITDFTRRTQAMVRYQMNDILIESESPCPCGSAMIAIKRIEGRCDDILIFNSTTDDPKYMFPDDIRAMILDSVPEAEDFTVIQQENEDIDITIKGNASPELYQVLKDNMSAKIKTMNTSVPNITFSDYHKPDISKKLRRIYRTASSEDLSHEN